MDIYWFEKNAANRSSKVSFTLATTKCRRVGRQSPSPATNYHSRGRAI